MSPFDIVLRLAGVLVLVVLNAFFVAAEFGLVGARRSRLDQLAAAGDEAAALSRRMQDDLDRYIAAAQLGITLASLALGWVGESTIAALLEPPIELLLTSLLGRVVAETVAIAIGHGVGIAAAFFVITTLHIVLGEQAPKVYAIHEPEVVVRMIARPLAWFNALFSPIIHFLDWATSLTLRAFGIRDTGGGHARIHSAEELRMLVEESGEAGAIDAEAQEMLINVFAFGDRPAYQAMVPRTEVVTVERGISVREFLDRFATTGHTRFPVLGEDGIDDVRGIVSAKDMLRTMNNAEITLDVPIDQFIQPAFFTPESKHIGDLLREMRRHHHRMAILIDEYGGLAGVVTLEDLIEEIVGDLDQEAETALARQAGLDSRTMVVEGQMRIDDANDDLHLQLPSGEYETLAGFILDQLGRLPGTGDMVNYNGLQMTVIEMQGPRIKRVEISQR
jgi:CBS domain containing-hemolysin-like protein